MNKKKVKRIVAMICVSALMASMLCGCRQADIVRRNLSQEADAFNSYRCITVINCLQGDVLFQMKGKCSIVADTVDNQLEIIVEEDMGVYKKHIIGLSDNVTYVIEDITGNDVDNYNYELNFNPKMWLPYTVETVD